MADSPFEGPSEFLITSTISRDNSYGRTAGEDRTLELFGKRLVSKLGEASRSPSPGAFSNASNDYSVASNPSVSFVVHSPSPPLDMDFSSVPPTPPPYIRQTTKEAKEVPAEGPILQAPTPLPSRFPTVHLIKEEVSSANGELVPKADGELDCLEPSTRTVSPPSGNPRKRRRRSIESFQEDSFSEDAETVGASTYFCEVMTDCPSAP